MKTHSAVRVVAYFEAAKGLFILAAAAGLFSLVHKDVSAVAASLLEHAHLNPAARYPQIFLDAAANLNDSRLLMLAAGALIYSLVRLVEAYGLYLERPWAEVLAALSGAIYVPFEIMGLVREASWHGVALLAVNLAIVWLMVRAMLQRKKNIAASAT